VHELILHHYELSPFSEKIRRILGYKDVSWRSVDQPMMNPKPQLTPLTGGYRRIPVLQIGADIYCDTALIAREIERAHPEPTIFPDGTEGAASLLSLWADRQLFFASIPLAMTLMAQLVPPEFAQDRVAMGFDLDKLSKGLPDARNHMRAFCGLLARQLEGRDFLLGARFSLADAAVYNPLWFLRDVPEAQTMLQAHPVLQAWYERLTGMGRGKEVTLEAAEALAIAKAAAPATPEQADPGDPNGTKPGDRVTIMADDYGSDPIAGTIQALSEQDVAIRREHPEVGEVVVHFPRTGYRIIPA
jgi:glutathione S-transferase